MTSVNEASHKLELGVSNNCIIDDDDDELSKTLLERRKRLHELASEINQWEDEASAKK